MSPSLHAIAEVLALRLLDSVVEGSLICILAALVLRLAPQKNAATRFAVWFCALVAVVGLPWISGAWLHTGITVAAVRRAPIMLSDSWAVYFLGLWSAVAGWFGLGVARALWHLHVLRRNGLRLNTAELDPVLRETLNSYGVNRKVVLCTSEDVRVPTAVGLLKPMILVPSWVMRELSPSELSQILLHELAHFRRWDDWSNLVQQIVKALFFFHPAVWWIDKRIAVEREMACDDAVLAETKSPRAYAECLARLAEKSFVNRSIALAQAALGKIRQTSARVAHILEVRQPAPTSRPAVAVVSLVVVLALAGGALYSRAPKLVAFGSPVNASRTELAEAPASSAEPEPVRHIEIPVRQAKLTERPVTRPASRPGPALALQAKSPKAQEGNLVHLTGSQSPSVPFTETFWVVVESGSTNPAAPRIYQFQMWRVTVLRAVIRLPSHQVPRKT